MAQDVTRSSAFATIHNAESNIGVAASATTYKQVPYIVVIAVVAAVWVDIRGLPFLVSYVCRPQDLDWPF